MLTDVSLGLAAGEVVGLIGPNGCGKSTLLKVLSGVLPLKAGQVTLSGVTLKALSMRDVARRVAFVPQEEASNFDFTVQDIVLMGRYAHRGGGPETADDYLSVERALRTADCLHLRQRLVTQLSGGEHKRVLLARALSQDAPVMLLDEPTAHLDITHQVEVYLLARKLSSESQIGVLMAIHDLNQAAEFCDRLILMESGRVIVEGSPDCVLTANNLRMVYHARAEVGINPLTGKTMILSVLPERD